MPDIASWLARLGLDKYIDAFTTNEVDLDALQHLSEGDLKELGLPLGPRRKIMAAIASIEHEAKLPPPSVAIHESARPSRDAERRQLTVMFVDLVGSTDLSQRLDPEEMRDIIKAYQSTVSQEISRYEGHVAKLMGDGVLAYFGWPRAHEDDAERAVLAALAAAAATANLATPRGAPLSARIGIATGLVVVGDLIGEGSAQEEAVIGETPNLAARLQALAEPSTVVIADSTHRLISGLFESVDLGHKELKGFASPVRAWRIAREAGSEGRFDAQHGMATPLVGRAEELELLLQRWRQARAGKGQVVLLSGEPGIGKSRLNAALHERLGGERHTKLRYFCSPYHMNSTLYPVIKQIERAAGLQREDGAAIKIDKLKALLRQAMADIAEAGSLLASLLSIDTSGRYEPMNLTPQAQKMRTLTVLSQLLKGFAAREPAVMQFEDTHWIDPTTAEWLDMLIEELRDMPVLLIVSYRPEFQPRWTLSSHITALSLNRLGRDQGAEIIDRVASRKSLPEEVRNQILAKTEGVPLFIEELTKTVLESGLLADAGDHYVLSGPLPPFAIPSTLRDSLMARLDRLAPVREVAQVGACLGRVFHYRLLAAVAGFEEPRLESTLQQLEKSELVFRRGVPPEATYTFKHAMVQDTAYQSLLKSKRQQIHSRIASILETKFPDVVEAEPETLAYHFTAAGLAEQAVAYWLKAGKQAQRRSANAEAESHLAKGLDLIASLPESEDHLRQELDLQSAMRVTMIGARGWGSPEVLKACTRARELCEKLGDTSQLFIALCGEASYHMMSGKLAAADELGHRCLKLAHASGDQSLLIEAHHLQWSIKYYMGDYDAAEHHTDYGIATYDPDRHHSLTYIYTGHDPGVCCRYMSAQILWLRGYPDQALNRSREAVALAERVSHPLTRVMAQSALGRIHLLRGEPGEGRRWVNQVIALSREFVLPQLIANGTFELGWALAQDGHMKDGVRMMREGVAGIATGMAVWMQSYLYVLAWACGECGRAAEGLSLLDRAFGIVTESGTKYLLPELLRVKGDLLLRLSSHDNAAEEWFQKALTAARDDGLKSLELRAALSLARLYCDRGCAGKAHEVLFPVYNWFTEGFETRDLVEAKDLLDQLR
jgi:class 3 adenylate cyclase/tetratricopeptide (TPR) repeat protein